jgi:hypothetical protein
MAGSAPFAVLLLLYTREAGEAHFVPGTVADAVVPLALGLGLIYFLRYPFRLALARWMGQTLRGEPASVLRATAWAFAHVPTALLYGSLSTLGWSLGALVFYPALWMLRANLAFHRFASATQGAWENLRETERTPLSAFGARLTLVSALLFLVVFLVFWATPGVALDLADWLFKAPVSPLRGLFAFSSVPWLSVALVATWVIVETLWSVSFGIVAMEWQNLSRGADLLKALHSLEDRPRSLNEGLRS